MWRSFGRGWREVVEVEVCSEWGLWVGRAIGDLGKASV